MNCPACDTIIPDDARSCIVCGATPAPACTGATRQLEASRTLALDPAMFTSAFTITQLPDRALGEYQ